MRIFALVMAGLLASANACIGGNKGGCCPPAQPACGNPCGGGVGPAPAGPIGYAAPPPAGGYAVAGKK